MKKSLTSIAILLLVLLYDLSASTYKWSAKADKKTAYINEAILLTYVCKFSDASELYSIDFNPVQENEHFSIQLLKESQGLKNSSRINTYEFIAYVKKAGPISFDFDAVMKKTTQASIDSTTNGHYDDSKVESFVSTLIKQLSLSLSIKETPSQLVGELALTVKHHIHQLKVYEPYNLEIQIEGVGNFFSLTPIDFNIDGVKVFTQAPVLQTELTPDGEKGVWSQQFAFVAKKSFVIPAITIEYFDIQTAKVERLRFDGVSVNVANIISKREEEPDVKEKRNYFYKEEYLYYLLVFLSGFLVGKIKRCPKVNRSKQQRRQDELFKKSIKETSSLEKLCFLLVNRDVKKYEDLLSKIESKELSSLKKAKYFVLRDDI